MREVGAKSRRYDDRDRSADAKLHAHVFGDAKNAKHLEQHRHDDRTAADAERAGKQSSNYAADDDRKREPKDFVQPDAEEHLLRTYADSSSRRDVR